MPICYEEITILHKESSVFLCMHVFASVWNFLAISHEGSVESIAMFFLYCCCSKLPCVFEAGIVVLCFANLESSFEILSDGLLSLVDDCF